MIKIIGKRLLVIGLVMIMLAVFWAGCGKNSGKGEGRMNKVEMTEEEVRLLCAVYTGEKRIQDGMLMEFEKAALDQFRAGMKYLEEKYHSYEFKVLTYGPLNKLNTTGEIRVEAPDGEVYNVGITLKDEEIVCSDNFYASLITKEYNKKLEKLFTDAGLTVKVDTKFPQYVGNEANENTSLDELLKLFPKLNRLVKIYYDGADSFGVKDKVEAVIRENSLYGSYNIYFVPVNFERSLEELEAERSKWEMDFFTVFDID